MTYKSLFITGTDTAIGKTTVSCILAASLRRRGLNVGVFKPAETGCALRDDGTRFAEDAHMLKYFSQCDLDLSVLCPYVLSEPLAPLMAARLQQVTIRVDHLIDCHRQIAAAHDITLIEGAGGLLVPLADGESFADLAKRLDAAVVVVVGNRLGAINHARLTVEHARYARLNVAGYILNQLRDEIDLAASTNVDLLGELLGPALGAVPFIHDLTCTARVAEELARIGEFCVDLDSLLVRQLSG